MSLYLSRLLLNPRSRQVMMEMVHPYEMHRTLMRAFPNSIDDIESKARGEFGVLFRADVDDLTGVVMVYVQSRIEPNWSFLDGRYDYLCRDTGKLAYACKDIMPACAKIQDGQVFSFRLRANPTKRVGKVTRGDSDLKGKRVGLLREDEQIAWLIRKGREREKGRPGGFEILMAEVVDRYGQIREVPRVEIRREEKQRGRKKGPRTFDEMTHLAVRFDGLLRITDANAFRETLARGIGSAKAFGFGLLSVAPG
ncbi:MAG: type I-E CRISPR-associated protein Cas6/Cse3/CasE [Deltaproteobacteria bacterium]|nr:type I-E CRISPR-associated protein Cas6/Cse3/CasE [Deltaproteobacteria bacterium]